MKNNGGFAFPFQTVSPNGDPYSPESGMTLRDYFAGQALSGMCASETEYGIYVPEAASVRAYRFADAMIAERNKEAQP